MTTPPHPHQLLPTLLDLSARTVARIYPFQLIEERYKIIPEPVQRKIIFHAFPRQEKDVFLYSSCFADKEFDKGAWECGRVLQVGFLLVGEVVAVSKGTDAAVASREVVRVQFDRCKITSISCTCTGTSKKPQEKLIFWCDHVVAIALFRIQNAGRVEIRVPISETLTTLTRPQLQKLVQYLLQEHPAVLPSAQNLADSLLSDKNNAINEINGAPDITAGGAVTDENCWAFNEANMAELIKENVYDEGRLEGVVGGLFGKILSMTSHSDTNGPRILTTITQTFLSHKPPHRTALWDQITSLWQITVMNPAKSIPNRESLYLKLLTTFNAHPNIPLDENGDPLLKTCIALLKTDYAKKSSDLFLNCLRVGSLECHGFKKEAFLLARKIGRQIRKTDNFTIDYDLVTVIYRVFQENKEVNEAAEFALLNLGQGRTAPGSLYLQERWLRTEETFINNLKLPEKQVFERFSTVFLEKQYLNCLPLYNFGKFVYKHCPSSTTFKLAVKYLKMPVGNTLIQTTLEHQQVNLSLLLINNSKNSKKDLETLLKTLSNSLKSVSSLFRIAQESSRIEETNANLINFSFNLGLHILKTTLKYNHRRRWDIVRWVMNCSLSAGFFQILHLMNNWGDYFTASEAVGTVASQFLSRGTSLRLNLGFQQQQRLGEAARGVAVGGMRVDPGNCSLNALTICESDPVSFETAYQIILEAAGSNNKQQSNLLNCQQIFTIARYMEHRGYPLRAYKLAAIAIGHLHIPFNQETHTSISDIHWSCTLAQSLGDTELCNLLPVIISNIKCASVLSEILKRAAMEPPRKCHRNNSGNKIYSRLKLLVEATINSYITTIHNRLAHISPRHYADFIEYLGKAKECFMFAPSGVVKWGSVVSGIKREYKGKKKLVVLVAERFG